MSAGRTIRRGVLITLGVIFFLLSAAFVLVHTSPVTNYARGKIVQVAEAKLGTHVSIQSLSIPWDQVAVKVRGITINGRAPSQAPLLQIPRLEVSVQFVPLLSGHLRLSDVVIDRAIVRIETNAQGQSNFPKPASSAAEPAANATSSTVDSLFSLAIHHLEVAEATISYKNSTLPISADLKDFNANVYFDNLSDEFQGTLRYGSGWVTVKNFVPVENRANLRFTASRSGMTFDPLIVTLPESQLTMYATLQNYSQPRVNGKYVARISTTEVANVLRSSMIPSGNISGSGTFRYSSAQGKAFWDALRIQGTLSSSELTANLRQFRAPVDDLRASYLIEHGELRIINTRGRALGGQLNVTSGQLSLTGESPSELDAALTNVSVHELGQELPARHERLNLIGRADLSARLSWKSHFRELMVDARAEVASPPERVLTSGGISLNGAVQLAYNGVLDRASLANSQLRIGSTTFSASGVLSKNSNLMLTLTAKDLHEFSLLAEEIERATSSNSSAPVRLPNINGSGQFTGQAHGSIRNPQVSGRLTGRNLQIDSTRWTTIQTNIAVSPSRAAITDGLLLLADRGRIQVDASIGLHRWSVAPSSRISLHLVAEDVPLSSLQELTHVHYPVRGTLSADVSARGTRQNPAGNGWIRVVKATAWNQPLNSVSFHVNGNSNSLRGDLAVASSAGPIAATAVYHPRSKTYQFSVHIPGLQLGQLEMIEPRHLPVHGILVANGNGSGAIDNPEFSITVESPQLGYHGETISNLRSILNFANREANFTTNARLYDGQLTAEGKVALTDGYEAAVTLDIHSVSVGLLAAQYLRPGQPAPKGQADLHAVIQGPLKNPSQLMARVVVPAMTVEYQPVKLSLVTPLVMEYQKGLAVLKRSEIKGTGVDLSLAGQIPVKSSEPFSINANGKVNLSFFQGMTPGLQAGGQLDINIAAQGKLAQPNMQGSLQLRNVSLSSLSMPFDLSGINGNIRVAGSRMEIVNLSGQVNGGSLNAQGSVDLSKGPTFSLAVAAQSVDVSYPAGVRARVGGNLQLTGTSAASALTGRMVIDYLGLTQQMDITTLASKFSSGGGVSTPSPFERHMKINVAVQSSSTLSLASNQLSIQGAANLFIVGTMADPVVLGRATLTGGELFFLGKRYEIKSGTIEFANATRTQPSLDLYATTTVKQYDISIHFLGPVDQMKTSFTSTPPLPQADVINLLAFGQTTEAAGTAAATPGKLGAESVVAQGVASQISGKIQKLAGISQLAITPILASSQQNPGAQVAIQQRVSGRLLVTFTTNTAETQSTAVQVQYRLGHGLSVSVLRDQNGGYGADVHLHKSF